MNVLLATDGTDAAATAIQTALRLLSPLNRNLTVLCVAPAWGRPKSASRTLYEEKALAATTSSLEKARAIAAPAAKEVTLETGIGSAAAIIADKSAAFDLTVIGSGGAPEAGLGPVARRVVEHASGALLIGRRIISEEGLRVLVAVDGSVASLRAIETLGDMFDMTSAEVCAMHVAETIWLDEGPGSDFATASDEEREASEPGQLEKEFVREGEEITEEARDILRDHCLLVNVEMAEGNPAGQILAEAERGQYDLVVIGATGNRDVKHQMLGSVSARIAWEAPCSVLIVREPGETG